MKRQPIAMSVITAAEVAATAPGRFASQYADHPDERHIGTGDRRRPLGETRAALACIEPTPEAISEVLSPSWAHPTCDLCGQLSRFVAHAADTWMSVRPRICLSCAEQAVLILSQMPTAGDAVPVPTLAPAQGELP